MEVGLIVIIKDLSYFISSINIATIFAEHEVRIVLFIEKADISSLKPFLEDPIF
jgi:hypothetical protein